MTYKLGVVIGRFRPFHRGHKALIEEALRHSDQVVIVVGSKGEARSIRNPWLCDEVEHMIANSFDLNLTESGRLQFIHQPDFLYDNDIWLADLQERIEEGFPEGEPTIFGYTKDASSNYLKWGLWPFQNVQTGIAFDATTARLRYFSNIADSWLKASGDMLPPFVIEYLRNWKLTPDYLDVYTMNDDHMDYVRDWGAGPHLAGDALVHTQKGFLCIRRPEGTVAMPGGFLGHNETLEDCAKRELAEETGLVLDAALWPNFTMIADAPYRDYRARIISGVYFWTLELTDEAFQLIKAADDAAAIVWVPTDELDDHEWHADHKHIIRKIAMEFNL